MQEFPEVHRSLKSKFGAAALFRPERTACYDVGDELVYEVTGLCSGNNARVHLLVEKYAGGGFAGQVYRVKLSRVEGQKQAIDSLEAGVSYAMKILLPCSSGARFFRNFLYWVGFQGPFQLQVNPTAARAGALWQKFTRRAAGVRFGSEDCVVHIHATFVDERLGSCGELSEWVEGRTWQLEVDDHMDYLKAWLGSKDVDEKRLGSAEYREKKIFMKEFVRLLHDIGGDEFARQYEWSTCKSQPNCLKRYPVNGDSSGGLVAVDFRAGLALLPFLPMSPGDFKLIWQGLRRGSLVQFDRGDLSRLEGFVNSHRQEFSDMPGMLAELKTAEDVYRNSVPDITHNFFRLFYSGKLWSTIFDSAVTGWKVRNLIDKSNEKKFRANKISCFLFFLTGLIPFLGKVFRRLWARSDWRRHYGAILTSRDYFKRAIQGKIAEKVMGWHRSGRVSGAKALKISDNFCGFCRHWFLSFIPAAGWHRFFSDWAFAKEKLGYIFVRPVRLYFSSQLREQWLKEMVQSGKKKHILADEDAETILSHLKEPYVQRYLISLVVHLLTLPLTQIVSVIIAAVYYSKTGDKMGAGGIIVLFQFTPISPGSLARGFWAVGIAVYDRSFKDYNIAVFLSFFKYIGYLAFPIQMAYHYPVLARFMAAHWATEAVHIVPVFGERGALLEHWVFGLFYNWPLTIRRRMKKRAEIRAQQKSRYWHVGLCVIVTAGFFALVDFVYLRHIGIHPRLRDIWWLTIILPLVCGAMVTIGCGGAVLWKRIVSGAVGGIAMGLVYGFMSAIVNPGEDIKIIQAAKSCGWPIFVFTILSVIGVLITELRLPEPELA